MKTLFIALTALSIAAMPMRSQAAQIAQSCHGDKSCNEAFRQSMASCYAHLLYNGINAAEPRYEAVCRGLAEDGLKGKHKL